MTQTTRDNGHRPPSRPDRDPDRRPTPPDADGFWPGPITVCKRCCCLVPAAEEAQRIHRRHHETIAGLEDSRPR